MGVTIGLLVAIAAALWQGFGLLAGYIGGNAFPQPLSPEDEAKALDALQQGDPEARALLIEHNLRLVAHVVKKYASSGESADDLISIGTVGLIKAIDTFDAAKQVRLATYAARCIENDDALTSGKPRLPTARRGEGRDGRDDAAPRRWTSPRLPTACANSAS